MKNFLKIFSSENLKKNIKNISERFPVTLVIILLVAGLFFTELHYHSDISDFYNKRIFIAILALIMTFIFSISTYLSAENSNKTKLQRNLFQLIPLGF
jgi:membrane-bound acyltransferase YfiQ involved in biofilm formation